MLMLEPLLRCRYSIDLWACIASSVSPLVAKGIFLIGDACAVIWHSTSHFFASG